MAQKGSEEDIKALMEEYGLNEKQINFCRYYVKNGSAGLSYKKAYGDNMGKELAQGSCYTNGSRLLKKDNIQLYLNVLRKEQTKKANMEIADIISSLEDVATDVGQKTSDKLKALEMLGKYFGIWQDKVNVSNDMQIEINLTGDLEQEATGEVIEVNMQEKLEDNGKESSI
jgi:hypothetical protein